MGEFIVDILRNGTPVLLVALGVLVMQLSGIMNIGAEGMMLIASFSGVLGTHLLQYEWLGVLFAVIVGAVFGLIFAFLTIHLKGDQVVIGVAFNIMAEGLTTTLSRQIFGKGSQSTIDGIKPILFGMTPMVFIALALVVILSIFLYKTNAGLRIRAGGENPRAVDTAGISVYSVQYKAVILGSMIIALGGCALSMAQLNSFSENMVLGRGFIALAAVVLGKYRAVGVMLAALLFGAGDALQYRLQVMDINFSHHFLRMIPYALTVIAVVISGRRNSNVPEQLAVPYYKLK